MITGLKPVTMVMAFFLCLYFAGCDTVAGNDTGNETTELEGTWTGTESGSSSAAKIIVSGHSITAYLGGTEIYTGTFTLTTTTTPKYVDTEISESSLQQYIGKSSKGIYKIEDGVLTITSNEPGDPNRPESFLNRRTFIVTKE